MTPLVRTICSAAVLAAAGAAAAQQVYRQVGPGGRITYSDQPPPAAAPAAATRAAAATPATPGGAGLPFELRQVVQRYPVTLYSSDACGACDAGRSLLVTRGVPFDERSVKSPQDGEAFQRLTGQNSLPLLTIGTQQLKGFSDAEWSAYLDAAGYPKSNQLPSGYRQPAAAPLVAQQAAPAATPAAPVPTEARTTPPAPAASPLPDGPTPSNPAGIRF